MNIRPFPLTIAGGIVAGGMAIFVFLDDVLIEITEGMSARPSPGAVARATVREPRAIQPPAAPKTENPPASARPGVAPPSAARNDTPPPLAPPAPAPPTAARTDTPQPGDDQPTAVEAAAEPTTEPPAALLTVPLAVAAAEAADRPRLVLPIRCAPGTDCWIANYVDTDPTSAARDYTCGKATYDGHKGTDFAIRDLRVMR